MKVYFARPVTHYNTHEDNKVIQALERAGFEVVNPNTPEFDAAYKEHGMSVFTKAVAGCDLVAYVGFSDDAIGAGVWKETLAAAERNIPVLRLHNFFRGYGGLLNVDATRERVRAGGV